MSEFFKGIDKIKYEGSKSTNPLAFKFYDPNAVIGGKTMREQLRFAMSYWHTLCGDGCLALAITRTRQSNNDQCHGNQRGPEENA